MADDSTAREKRELRKEAARRRKDLHAELAEDARRALRDTGLDFLETDEPTTVSGFLPYGSEIDCTALLHRLAGEGWITCLPVVTGPATPLLFRAWSRGHRLQQGVWDIPVPADSAAELDPDILLVPLLAFDERGFRLGYGGGFYDRTMQLARSDRRIVAVGVAFSGQEVPEVPHCTHDEPLDWMLTERGATRCRGRE